MKLGVVSRILAGMPVRLHHVVVDAHDLSGLARFWAQALGWRILFEHDREVVIGPEVTAPIGMCFMPVPDGTVCQVVTCSRDPIRSALLPALATPGR